LPPWGGYQRRKHGHSLARPRHVTRLKKDDGLIFRWGREEKRKEITTISLVKKEKGEGRTAFQKGRVIERGAQARGGRTPPPSDWEHVDGEKVYPIGKEERGREAGHQAAGGGIPGHRGPRGRKKSSFMNSPDMGGQPISTSHGDEGRIRKAPLPFGVEKRKRQPDCVCRPKRTMKGYKAIHLTSLQVREVSGKTQSSAKKREEVG